MAVLTKVLVTCPHAICGNTFSYPQPTLELKDIAPETNEVIEVTTCPICEQAIKVRFEIERETEVYRGGKNNEQGRLVFKCPSVVVA